MLAIAQRRSAMLCSGGCLSGHLELANLPIREATIVAVVVRILLRLYLLIGLGLRRRLSHVGVGSFAVT